MHNLMLTEIKQVMQKQVMKYSIALQLDDDLVLHDPLVVILN
jgi:hypothetical protein